MSDFKMVPVGTIKIPETLYKYRDWSNIKHKSILCRREIYFAPPNSFEDLIDCRVPIRYDLLTDEEIFNRYFDRIAKENPNWTNLKKRAEARFWFNKGLLRDENRLKEEDEYFWKDFNKRFGVLSLTANPVSIEMWKKYAKNHEGVCVGFNSEALFRDTSKVGGGGEVIYFKEFPIIHPFEEPMQKMLKQIYFKSDKWSFEEEYRVHKMHPNHIEIEERFYQVPEDATSKVILGCKMKKEEKTEVIQIVQNKCKHTKIFQAQLNNDRITIHPIE